MGSTVDVTGTTTFWRLTCSADRTRAAGPRSGAVSGSPSRARAPTDPDVQISRIRLLELRFRCARIDAVNDSWRQERIALQ